MRRLARRRSNYSLSLVGAILALGAASILVWELQRRLVVEREQTLRRLCSEVVTQAKADGERYLSGPVQDVVRLIRHPELKRYELAFVADYFNSSAARESYVDGFFLWHERFPASVSREVLFHSFHRPGKPGVIPLVDSDGSSAGDLVADSRFGARIFEIASSLAADRPGYTLSDVIIDGEHYQVLVHYYYHEPLTRTLFGLVGYVVKVAAAEKGFIDWLTNPNRGARWFAAAKGAPVDLRITDARAQTVHGAVWPHDTTTASATLDLSFVPPPTFSPAMGRRPAERPLTLTVGATAPEPTVAILDSWAALGAVAMIAVALFFTVKGIRQQERLSEMQSAFVAHVSHQLKTPIAILSGVTETLRQERVRSPDKVREYVEVAHVQALRLASLVDRILMFSKAKEGSPAAEAIDVGQLVEASIAAFTHRADGASLGIRFERPAVPLMVYGDPDALDQVIVNLIENAVKYGAKGREVAVSLDVADGHVIVSVRDHGEGIEPSEIPHLFEKFYRGKSNGLRAAGFGLGLAIVREVVEAHGGRVTVDSQKGSGSVFRVFLPVIAREAA